jgi:hypothetical protein
VAHVYRRESFAVLRAKDDVVDITDFLPLAILHAGSDYVFGMEKLLATRSFSSICRLVGVVSASRTSVIGLRKTASGRQAKTSAHHDPL